MNRAGHAPFGMRLTSRDFFASSDQAIAVEPRNPQDEFPLHDHDFDEIVIVMSGNGWHILNDASHYITCGEIFYIDAKDHHQFCQVSDLKLTNILYRFDRLSIANPSILPLLGGGEAQPDRLRHWQISEDVLARVQPLVAALETESTRPDALSQTLSEALFVQLLILLARNRFPVLGGELHRGAKLGHVLSWLRHRCTEPVDFDDVARSLGCSTRSLNRQFREVIGASPNQYLGCLRLNRAMNALRSSDRSICEVAFDSGYNDSNYFSFCFSRTTGMSPREYRRSAGGLRSVAA